MLDRQLFRTNPDLVRRGCARKGIDAPIDEVIRLDAERRETLATLERQQAEMNRISKSIGQLMAQGKREEAEAAKAQTKDLKEAIAAGEQRLREIEQALREAELMIPNLPHESVPDGLDETANVVIRQWGEKPSFDFEPKAHWDLAAELSLLDLPRGAKVAGSGFPCYVGMGARLQRALFQSMIEFQTRERGYTEVYPPYLVNRASMIGTGNFPKFEEDVYRADEDLWLIPTAEVPVTNLYRDEILDGD
ncbi:MAG: serine--tRNA ligase, partial [Armatimonadetes bacterium]|nr:serine--tRNA ligase [Armatimonadota bacterium]